MIRYQLAGRDAGPKDKYDECETRLVAAERCAVVNSRLAPTSDEKRQAYQALSTLLQDADELLTLPGWESSKLAVLEVAVAKATGIPVKDVNEALEGR